MGEAVTATQTSLLNRLADAYRKKGRLTFLVGSAVAAPTPGNPLGVPGVNEMIRLVEEELETPELREAFRAEIRLAMNQYQAAFQFLFTNTYGGEKTANRIIQTAVLRAFGRKVDLPLPEPDGFGALERDVAAWSLRPGLLALGEIVARHRDCFGPSVLTTNFDPLIEIALRRAGVSCDVIAYGADGMPPGNQKRFGDEQPPQVIHLHGYWHGVNTLHTPRQLTQDRPDLDDWITQQLSDRTIVVLGYAGWEDVFTNALRRVLSRKDPKLDVIWCFYEPSPENVQAKYPHVYAWARNAAEHVSLYYDIDCDRFLPSLRDRLGGGAQAPVAVAAPPAPAAVTPAPAVSPRPPEPPASTPRPAQPRRKDPAGFEEEVRARIAKNEVVVIAGGGVALAASGSGSTTWSGLLHYGIDFCEARLGWSLPKRWGAVMRPIVDEAINGDDLDPGFFIMAAEEISRRLNYPDGIEYATWLRQALGDLQPRHTELLAALKELGAPILTLNFDGLIEQGTGLPPITWLEPDRLMRAVEGREPGVVHLHGYWERPESVVHGIHPFGEKAERGFKEPMKWILQNKTILFVGCWVSFKWPSWTPILDWWRVNHGRTSKNRHFHVVRSGEVEHVRKLYGAEDRIFPLVYGDTHDDLPVFLKGLRARR